MAKRKEPNQRAIDAAIRYVEKRGLQYRAVTLIGSNFMSNAAHLQNERRFAVLAYKDERTWFVFTYDLGRRDLDFETPFCNEPAARRHFDDIVDKGIYAVQTISGNTALTLSRQYGFRYRMTDWPEGQYVKYRPQTFTPSRPNDYLYPHPPRPETSEWFGIYRDHSLSHHDWKPTAREINAHNWEKYDLPPNVEEKDSCA
jgi:hypothetical protein